MTRAFLDIDDTILKKNLLLDDKSDNELSEMLKAFEKPQVPFTLVRPIPGVCVKMRSEGGEKGFINICHTNEIPPPEDISDEKLVSLATSDQPSFVIPMSIGQERLEPDKGGVLCATYDIAINTNFFNKCQNNKIFMIFTTDVMVEAINSKFDKTYEGGTTLTLKNRKVIGKLQEHRIEKREVRKPQFPKKMIEEVEESFKSSKKTEPISIPQNSKVASQKMRKQNSDYVILQCPSGGEAEQLIGLFKLPTLNSKDVLVDVGGDRIIVDASDSDYLVDISVPYVLDQKTTTAEMDPNLGILRLTMPLKC